MGADADYVDDVVVLGGDQSCEDITREGCWAQADSTLQDAAVQRACNNNQTADNDDNDDDDVYKRERWFAFPDENDVGDDEVKNRRRRCVGDGGGAGRA